MAEGSGFKFVIAIDSLEFVAGFHIGIREFLSSAPFAVVFRNSIAAILTERESSARAS
jgi:hypothetical protein